MHGEGWIVKRMFGALMIVAVLVATGCAAMFADTAVAEREREGPAPLYAFPHYVFHGIFATHIESEAT
jgi:hypothetical protein